MNFKIYYLLFAFSFIGCSQNKKTDTYTMKLDTYINDILKNVKHSIDEEVFFLSIRASKSTYNIRVNDMSIKQSFDYEDDKKQRVSLNFHNLNKTFKNSGKQRISFSIYPFNRDRFKANDRIKITIEKSDKTGNLTDYIEYKPKMIDDAETPEFTDTEVHEGSFEFEAKLPYKKQIDWSESKSLKDQENTEQEVLEAYKEVMRLYAEGDLDSLLELYKPIFQDEAQSVYATKEKDYRLSYELNWERLHPFFYKSKPRLDADYELKFYADGRLVTLEKKKNTALSCNKSALSIIYDKDFDKFPDNLFVSAKDLIMFGDGTIPKKEMEIYLFFYKPKGSNTLKLATDIFRKEKLLNPIED